MKEQKFIRTCSIWRALEVIGDTSTLLIMEASWIGARRFEEFRDRTGLLQALLSNRLKRLVESGIMTKKLYNNAPKRYEYMRTAKGNDLYWTALMMLRWERQWGGHKKKLEIILRHRPCGHEFDPQSTCLTCGDQISARNVQWSEGPGVGLIAVNYSRRRQQRGAATDRSFETMLMDEIPQITGDRWATLVLRSIFTGLRKFDEIWRDTSMATNILSERISWLTSKGIIKESKYSEHPRRLEYKLTEKGIDYFPILLCILQWGDKHYASPEGPPLILRHHNEHALEAAVTCSSCSQTVTADDVAFEVVEVRSQN